MVTEQGLMCKVAKQLGYKNVSKFKEQPIFVRKDVKDKTKVYKDKDGHLVVEF